MAKLSDLPERDRNRSLRFNKVWRPLGSIKNFACCSWPTVRVGALPAWCGQVVTSPTARADFLTAVAPAIASATRLAVRSEARGWGPNGHPAIVLVGSGGEVSAVTPAAGEWRERLDQIAQVASW